MEHENSNHNNVLTRLGLSQVHCIVIETDVNRARELETAIKSLESDQETIKYKGNRIGINNTAHMYTHIRHLQ